jgi:hypothetical protein
MPEPTSPGPGPSTTRPDAPRDGHPSPGTTVPPMPSEVTDAHTARRRRPAADGLHSVMAPMRKMMRRAARRP